MFRNMIKNPNWQEATSWLFTKRDRVESGNKSKPGARFSKVPKRFGPEKSLWNGQPLVLESWSFNMFLR